MPNPNAGQVPAPLRPPPSRVKRVVAWLGVSIVALGAAYAAGRLQTASKIGVLEQRMRSAGDARDRMAAELAAERAKSDRLQARRRLHLALMALDVRNFGIAEAHLAAAASLLDRAKAGAPAGAADLQKELAAARLVATEDIALQRQRIQDWTRRFDSAEPAP